MGKEDIVISDTLTIPKRNWIYPEEVKKAAFLVWFENGHKLSDVKNKLENDEATREVAGMSQWDPSPEIRTLTNWQQEWVEHERRLFVELAQERKRMAVLRLYYASDDAAMTLARVARGDVQDVAKDKVASWAADKLLQRTHPDANALVINERAKEIIDYDEINDEAALFEAERMRRERG
jgi:hypothetical protein